MATRRIEHADNVQELIEAVTFGIPTGLARLVITGDAERVRKAGWEAYDALVRISTEATNQLYANSPFGDSLAVRTRWRCIGAAISSGAQVRLWPQIGAWLREHDR